MLSTREETDEVIVKLGDFGLSTFLEDEQALSTYAGTKEYLAPVSCLLSVGIVSLRTC
jgi:serine/threonine protein kinase